MDENFDVALAEAEGRAANILSGLPVGFDIAMLTPNSKIPFKALLYREGLIHRFADLAQTAVDAFKAQRPISAATVTRAMMETLARLMEFHTKVDIFLTSWDVDNFDAFLMSRIFGSRNNADLIEATNILSAIDSVTKKIDNYRTVYDNLSEMAHPNYVGTSGLFSQIDKDRFYVNFPDQENINNNIDSMIHGLNATLELFEYYYNDVGDKIVIVDGRFDGGSDGVQILDYHKG